MSRLRAASATIALTLLLAACGSDGSTTESTASAAAGNDAAAELGFVLEGSFPTVAGGQVDLGAVEGQDTVLWFWAPW